VSYYKFIKGGRIIPTKFAIPLLFELEKERGITHISTKIAKFKRECGPHGGKGATNV